MTKWTGWISATFADIPEHIVPGRAECQVHYAGQPEPTDDSVSKTFAVARSSRLAEAVRFPVGSPYPAKIAAWKQGRARS